MANLASESELLEHIGWLRRLATCLVRDAAAADDAVQDAWLAALQRPPRAGETVRPWLGEVLRNVVRVRWRSDVRRGRREESVGAELEPSAPSGEELATAAELRRLIGDEVLRLRDPYRATVLLCFFEGLTPSEVAAREQLPAGTVRWRLKQGLDQLRRRLDERHGGRREVWVRALVPVTGRAWMSKPLWRGAAMVKTSVVVVLATGVFAISSASTNRRSVAAPRPSSTVIGAQTSVAAAPSLRPSREAGASAARTKMLRQIAAARKTTAPVPSTSAGAPTELDAGYVQRQMGTLIPLVEECYEHAAERDGVRKSTIQGQIFLRLTVSGDSTLGALVADSRIIDAKSSVTDGELRECIQETVYAARFPAPITGGDAVIEYPFSFGVFAPDDDEHVDEAMRAYQEHRYRDVLSLADGLKDPARAARFRMAASCGLGDRAAALAIAKQLGSSTEEVDLLCAKSRTAAQ